MPLSDKGTVALDDGEFEVLDAIRRAAPRHHISPKLAQAYGAWTLCYRRYCRTQNIPWRWMSSVSDFMDVLDAHPNVSGAERNRALDGIMFYITDVHDPQTDAPDTDAPEDDDGDDAADRAASSVPRSTQSLFARMLLRCDVELNEALRLRRADVDLDAAALHVPDVDRRDTRTVSLPAPLREGLRIHVERVERRASTENPLLFGPHAPEGRDPAGDADTEADLDRSTELATQVMKTFGDAPDGRDATDGAGGPANER